MYTDYENSKHEEEQAEYKAPEIVVNKDKPTLPVYQLMPTTDMFNSSKIG